MNKFVIIVICLLLAGPLKRAFLTLTIICRNNSNDDQGRVYQNCKFHDSGAGVLTPVSYTHLTLPTICSV